MMVRRTKAQWQELFKAQQASGQTNVVFCRQHQLDPKYYSLRKQQLSKSQSSDFVLAKPRTEQSNSQTENNVARLRVIDIEFGADSLNVEDVVSMLGSILR